VRYANKLINFTRPKERAIRAVANVLSTYDLVCCAGLPYTGKTTAMTLISSLDNNPIRWSREAIMRQLFTGDFDLTYLGIINKAEQDLFKKAIKDGRKKFYYEGWLTTRRARRRVLNMFGGKKTCLLLFDAPVKPLVNRIVDEEAYGWVAYEALNRIARTRSQFEWPTKTEGWDTVVYVNTFGQPGMDAIRAAVQGDET